jgi:transposase InsO family protein
VLRVSTNGFYGWLKRPPSVRAKAAAMLRLAIKVAFEESRCTYGSPRIHRELVAQGFEVSKTPVEREMRRLGLLARRPKRFRVTTDSAHDMPIAENTLGRRFEASQPNRIWTTDITYVWTREGWLYLVVIIDLFSRRVVGTCGPRLFSTPCAWLWVDVFPRPASSITRIAGASTPARNTGPPWPSSISSVA